MGWAGREGGKIERKGGREEDREALNKQSLLPPRPIPPPLSSSSSVVVRLLRVRLCLRPLAWLRFVLLPGGSVHLTDFHQNRRGRRGQTDSGVVLWMGGGRKTTPERK